MSEDVWSARDTTPSAIEAALRTLLGRRYQEDRSFVPARVMNLVVIVDRSFRGEVEKIRKSVQPEIDKFLAELSKPGFDAKAAYADAQKMVAKYSKK